MTFLNEVNDLVKRYADAVHTQNEEDFRTLWTNEESNILISGTRMFRGIDEIYGDFLKDGIGQRYLSIDLINDRLEAYPLTEDTAIAVFRYHTDCIIRENGKRHGIAGLETQVLKKKYGQWKIAHIQYAGKEIQFDQ